jgi:hypothetical protein
MCDQAIITVLSGEACVRRLQCAIEVRVKSRKGLQKIEAVQYESDLAHRHWAENESGRPESTHHKLHPF